MACNDSQVKSATKTTQLETVLLMAKQSLHQLQSSTHEDLSAGIHNRTLLLLYCNNVPCVSLIFPIWNSMKSYVLDIVERIVDFYWILV